MLICDNIYNMDSETDPTQKPEPSTPETELPVQVGEPVREVVNNLLQQALEVRESRQADLDKQLELIERVKELRQALRTLDGFDSRLQSVRIKAAEGDLEAVTARLASPIVIPPDIYNQ